MLEKIIQKLSPSLYNAMGVYLPLITTNCAVLGVCELLIPNNGSGFLEVLANSTNQWANYGWAVLYAVFAGLGFTLVMIIMSGMREKLNTYKVSKCLQGFPISMVTSSFICMAFTIFTYIV
jgi:electron transport complex protein RnfA